MNFSTKLIAILLVFVSLQMVAEQKKEFTISSSGVLADGSLSIKYTGEGAGVSMPLQWSEVPEGTKYFAINLWHLPHPTDSSVLKSYWLVYNIPADVRALPEDAKGFGSVGYNDKDKADYDPMKSKGPGVKEYNLTIYALSDKLKFENSKVYRRDLLKAIEGKVLGQSTLKYTYETGKVVMSPLQERAAKEREDENAEALTAMQKEQVIAILSNYNAATLTATEANAIHEAFRKAGLRGGPAAADAIREAGFDPDKLRDLAPPQGMGEGDNVEDKR